MKKKKRMIYILCVLMLFILYVQRYQLLTAIKFYVHQKELRNIVNDVKNDFCDSDAQEIRVFIENDEIKIRKQYYEATALEDCEEEYKVMDEKGFVHVVTKVKGKKYLVEYEQYTLKAEQILLENLRKVYGKEGNMPQVIFLFDAEGRFAAMFPMTWQQIESVEEIRQYMVTYVEQDFSSGFFPEHMWTKSWYQCAHYMFFKNWYYWVKDFPWG